MNNASPVAMQPLMPKDDQDVVLVPDEQLVAPAAAPIARQILGPMEQLLGQIEAIAQGNGPYATVDEPTIVEA